jgi:hypothetical protein
MADGAGRLMLCAWLLAPPMERAQALGGSIAVVRDVSGVQRQTAQSNATTWDTLATLVSAAVPSATYLRPPSFLGRRLLKFGLQFDL